LPARGVRLSVIEASLRLSVQRKKAMAAITATLAVSIKISGKSKPANARTFDMGTTLKYPDTEGKGPAKRG
jgi:hypothetical protein